MTARRRSWSTDLAGVPGILAAAVYVLDQATKLLIVHLHPRAGFVYHEVIPGFFSIVHFRNPGAAWGIFARHTWVLGLVSALAFLLIAWFFDRLTERRRVVSWAYGCLLGGIAGNLYDRWFRRSVVDFLFFYWGDYAHSWPAFNVADSFITVSVAVLVVHGLLRPGPGRGVPPAGAGAAGEGG